MTTQNIINLSKMLHLLSDPSCWTRGELARDADGYPVPANSRHAVCYCVEGAAIRAAEERVPLPSCLDPISKIVLLDKSKPYISVSEWNDDPQTTHEEVLATIERAIEIEKNISLSQETYRRSLEEARAKRQHYTIG